MDYRKYSKAEFDSLGIDTDAARDLASALEVDVLCELHSKVKDAFFEIVERLNDEGHRLQPYGDILPGDISFTEQGALRLAVDTVISAGFSHSVEDDA